MNYPFFLPALRCLLFVAAAGCLAFLVGRIVPKKWFRYDRFPYRGFPFEREGKVYEALGVRRWKEKLPDMCKLLPRWIPSKAMPAAPTARQVENMIQETCVAELVHGLLCLAGLGLLALWRGLGGWVAYVFYLFGNLPYCIIQRYNRPKLVRILHRLQRKEAKQVKEAAK